MSDDSPQKSAIQSQLLGMDAELQSAINTLLKLKAVTGSLEMPLGQSPPRSSRQAPVGDVVSTIETVGSVEVQGTVESLPQLARSHDGTTGRQLAAGESFGRYQISRELGRGAMGAVYLAYDAQLERYVALKTPVLGDNPIAVQRFFREARSAARIRSPYVCPIYEVGDISGILYLTMAFIKGRPLSQWKDPNARTPDEVVKVFRKIAMGLQKAHVESVIHRDLKPDNIMVDDDDDPIIMDFGLARRQDDQIQLTSAGVLLGTPAYMSPEQVVSPDEIGPQSDIYSLGVVLYELLAGTIPFNGNLMVVLHKVVTEAPRPPSELQPQVQPGSLIERICLKMMAKNRNDRYGSMAEVLTDLDQLAGPQSAESGSKGIRFKAWQWVSDNVPSLGRRSKSPQPAQDAHRGAAATAPQPGASDLGVEPV